MKRTQPDAPGWGVIAYIARARVLDSPSRARLRCAATGSTAAVAIELHERSGSPNWVAGAPPMAVALADKFSAKIAALRKSDPIIDWSAAPSGRVAKFLSEV